VGYLTVATTEDIRISRTDKAFSNFMDDYLLKITYNLSRCWRKRNTGEHRPKPR